MEAYVVIDINPQYDDPGASQQQQSWESWEQPESEPQPGSAPAGKTKRKAPAKPTRVADWKKEYSWLVITDHTNSKGHPKCQCSCCMEHNPSSKVLWANADGEGSVITTKNEISSYEASEGHLRMVELRDAKAGGQGSIKAGAG